MGRDVTRRRFLQLSALAAPAAPSLLQRLAQPSPANAVRLQIAVTRLETRWKLSQNRSRREQELIAAQLEKSGDTMERALAALTRKHLAGE